MGGQVNDENTHSDMGGGVQTIINSVLRTILICRH